MKKIGFIGIGIMGSSMTRNLMKAGYELHIYTRTKSKTEQLIKEGAIYHESIKKCVADADAVITIVGYPKDVEEVYFEENGILDCAKNGAYLIDMTTTEPNLAVRINQAGKEKGFKCLDAPVTGGDAGAKNGTLSILVGGEKSDFEACMQIFEAMGTNIRYQGDAGCGQHAKMANQIMIAGTISGICEAFAYVNAKNLNPDTVLASVSSGAAGSNQLNASGKKIIDKNYEAGFFLKHFVKDMTIALEEAKKSNLDLNVLETVLKEYEELNEKGFGDLGTQALIEYYK